MRTVTVSLFALALAFVSGCGGDDDDSSERSVPSSEALAGTTYVSTAVMGYEFVEGTALTLGFPEADKLTAQSGCNSMFSDVRIEDDVLAVAQLGGTEIGCPPELQEQDEWIADFLGARPTIARAGDTLTLTTPNAIITLVDRRVAEPGAPLEGTRWNVESLITVDAVSSVPAGQSAHVEFDDGTVTANAGCNSVNGTATVAEGTISFGPIATTRKLCRDAQQLENHILEVLTGEVAYEIEGDQARLTHASGKGLVLRADG